MNHAAHGRRGQFLPLFALFAVVFMGMLALVVDVGYWRFQQRLEQSAADSAAIAGAIRLAYPTTAGVPAPLEVTSAARNASKANGFENAVASVTVTVNSPPTQSINYNGNSYAVEVTVSKQQPVFFGAIFGRTAQNVDAHAVAFSRRIPLGCVYQLDPAGGILMSTNGSLNAVGCGVELNGSANSGTITATSLSYTGVAPGATLTAPLVAKYSLPFSDPCATIPGCAYLRATAIPSVAPVNASGLTSLTPGSYTNCCAGATLAAGIYYLYGGFSGGFIGTGVTIVNADGSNITLGSSAAAMNIVAPTTGPSAGVAYYQAPGLINTYTAKGNPGLWAGLFYAPGLTYRTNGKQDAFAFLDIATTDINGSKSLTVDPSLASAGVNAAVQRTAAVLGE